MEETQVVSIAVNEYAVGAFIGYLLLLVGIGIYSSRFSSEGISEFFIGGRKMNRFVIALSAVVSGRSAWLLLGVTGMAYSRGSSAVWAVIGYIVVELFLFLYYARRLRNFSEKYNCITVPDFFAERFNDRDGLLRIALVLVFLIFMVGYVSSQFVAGGKAFASSFHIEQNTGILISAAIIFAYTVLGGFLAVSLTDMFQAIFMIFALVVLPFIAIMDAGGLQAVLAELTAMDPSLVDPLALSLGGLFGFLGIGLGSPGNPHILSRYMAIDDVEQLRWTAVVGTIWNVVMAWGALFIGLAGRVYFPEADMLPGADQENLYPVLAQQHLHPVIFGVVVASIFAAIMSTADSQLLVAASAVVRDVYDRIIKKGQEIPQKTLVLYSRIVVFILVIVALLFGIFAREYVFWLVLFAWAGLGAAIGPTSILALYWRGTTRAGVFAGLFTGTAVTIVWYYVPVLKNSLYELIPAFFLSLLATWLVSLYSKKPDHIDEAFIELEK
ncbi:MAG: sodium/proline symporter [Balneolaceae bacterium]|nr:sodium/proline symporter [Balneolaceae bacterium]